MPSLSKKPGRAGWLGLLIGFYLVVQTGTRITLILYEGEAIHLAPGPLAEIVAVGLLYDLAVASWLFLPAILAMTLWSNGPIGRLGAGVTAVLLTIALVPGLLFQAIAEGLFWNEFQSRFNFIAVDYLVYTREVVGNIWQSYPMVPMLMGLAGISLVFIAALFVPSWRLASAPAPTLRRRLAWALPALLAPAIVFVALTDAPQQALGEPAARELAGNGTYSLFRAFRNNDLAYDQFYRMLPAKAANAALAEEWREAGRADTPPRVDSFPARSVVQDGPARPRHVILISVESLGSDYVGAFGSEKGLTPNLDRIASEGLTFSNLHATGLRTVRGLEALSLSIPPTPGHAVPARVRNKGLDTIGSVLKQAGWDPLYIYGGYAWFDNMRDFFEGAGYTVLDRTDVPEAEIDHETIWGVADEDLFDMALDQIDTRIALGERIFAHIMTTSNHRPYTYPDGRVSIPSHTGRNGAVQYTDWAIGRFYAQLRDKPWFKDTILVIVADHTSHGRGRIDLPPENYRIPLIVVAPGLVEPGDVPLLASQIDVAPTILGLMNLSYSSHFFGQDILREGAAHQRAFMANYLTVGYMEHGLIAELAPQGRARAVDAASGAVLPQDDPRGRDIINEAISQYQAAAAYLEASARAEAVD